VGANSQPDGLNYSQLSDNFIWCGQRGGYAGTLFLFEDISDITNDPGHWRVDLLPVQSNIWRRGLGWRRR